MHSLCEGVNNKSKQSPIKILTGKSSCFLSPQVFNVFKSSTCRAEALEMSRRHAKLNFIPQPSLPLLAAFFHRKNRNLRVDFSVRLFSPVLVFWKSLIMRMPVFLLYIGVFYAKINIYPALPVPLLRKSETSSDHL